MVQHNKRIQALVCICISYADVFWYKLRTILPQKCHIVSEQTATFTVLLHENAKVLASWIKGLAFKCTKRHKSQKQHKSRQDFPAVLTSFVFFTTLSLLHWKAKKRKLPLFVVLRRNSTIRYSVRWHRGTCMFSLQDKQLQEGATFTAQFYACLLRSLLRSNTECMYAREQF